jgi:hypothetical protein
MLWFQKFKITNITLNLIIIYFESEKHRNSYYASLFKIIRA